RRAEKRFAASLIDSAYRKALAAPTSDLPHPLPRPPPPLPTCPPSNLRLSGLTKREAAKAMPVIYGADYSTYVRTVRLTFEEKPAEYRLEHVHFLGGEAQRPSHLRRQPFGKVPAFEHDGLTLYETDAIIRYVDQVFPGRRLQPD